MNEQSPEPIDRFLTAYLKKEDAQIQREALQAFDDKMKQEFICAGEEDKKVIVGRLLHLGQVAHVRLLALEWIAGHHKAGTPWDSEIYDIIRQNEDQEWFFRAIAEILRKGKREPLVSEEDGFLIDHWDSLTLLVESLPGLKHWTWTAISDFARSVQGIDTTPEAWRKRASRIDLHLEERLVRGFRTVLSSKGQPKSHEVHFKSGQKKYIHA